MTLISEISTILHIYCGYSNTIQLLVKKKKKGQKQKTGPRNQKSRKTIITKSKVIQILDHQLSEKDFKITIINMFKKIEENKDKIYGKIKVTKKWKYDI